MTVVNHAVTFPKGEPQPGDDLVLRIERLPLSLNYWTRKFWTHRSRDAADMRGHVERAFGQKRRQWCAINGPWFTVPVEVWLTYYVPDAGPTQRTAKGHFVAGQIDTDNLVPKHIIDALKKLAFADDTASHIPRVTAEVRRLGADEKYSYTRVWIFPYVRVAGD